MRRLTPTAIAAIAIGLAALVVIALFLARRGDVDQDKLNNTDLVAAEGRSPRTKCGSQKTYDLIKREIFRQAADTRGSDAAAFDRIAASASVRMERPVLKDSNQDSQQIRCAGSLAIDLPPGLSVVGGRRTLSTAIEYIIQPAADGSGDVVMIEGADSIIVPLATLASVRSPGLPTSAVTAIPGGEAGNVAGEPMPPRPPEASPPVAMPQRSAQPSFNCRFARTRGEIAVCRDDGLAALDRQMAAQYDLAAAGAGPRQRAVLRATRDSFLRYRDRCPSEACIAGAYRDRMREIEDIMAGRWSPDR